MPVQPANPVLTPQIIINPMAGYPGPLANPDPILNAYNQMGFTLLPAVVPENLNLKQFVGEFIYEYVEKFVGEEKAPRITEMLIDLPIQEIKDYLYDFNKLSQKVYEAITLLYQNAQ
jgi:hypothetical protein